MTAGFPAFPATGGATVAFVTQHGKERLLDGLLAPFGLVLDHVDSFDTDRLGRFFGHPPRAGSARDAARLKCAAAFEHRPGARFALASEGSFGPHPSVPWFPSDHELVLLQDRWTGCELEGVELTTDTTYGDAEVTSAEDALRWAEARGFPGQAVRVGERTFTEREQLRRATTDALRRGAVRVEAELRAHLNPKRRVAIRRALERCFEALATRCPTCDWPGFVSARVELGLPCEVCREPTTVVAARWADCRRCGASARAPVAATTASPGNCPWCNP